MNNERLGISVENAKALDVKINEQFVTLTNAIVEKASQLKSDIAPVWIGTNQEVSFNSVLDGIKMTCKNAQQVYMVAKEKVHESVEIWQQGGGSKVITVNVSGSNISNGDVLLATYQIEPIVDNTVESKLDDLRYSISGPSQETDLKPNAIDIIGTAITTYEIGVKQAITDSFDAVKIDIDNVLYGNDQAGAAKSFSDKLGDILAEAIANLSNLKEQYRLIRDAYAGTSTQVRDNYNEGSQGIAS